MIDLEKAKKEFVIYTNNYDVNNSNINRKIGHSLRVMEESKYIAENLNLTKEQIDLATLIGLLHDIARFEQFKQYRTFRDLKSIDHGDFGVQILEKNNFIRKFIQDDKYDEIIKKTIKNHNKYQIEVGLNKEELLQTKIIRDADKLDIFYEGVEIFWQKKEEIEEVNNCVMDEMHYNQFVSEIPVKRNIDDNRLEALVVFIAFIYDLNFSVSLKKIKKCEYINKILDKFKFNNETTNIQMNEIRKKANKYIQNIVEDDLV